MRKISSARARPGGRIGLLVSLLVLGARGGASAGSPGELLYFAENNRLYVLDLDTLEGVEPLRQVVVPSSEDTPARGRDVNGMICRRPDGDGGFVVGEDTGQPRSPAGWGLFDASGRQTGKLVASSEASLPDPYGCAFSADGQLFTTEIGDPGFLRANGQLLLWFPPFERFPEAPVVEGHAPVRRDGYCRIAADLGTVTGIAIDPAGRVYVATAGRMQVLRFSPPFPTGADRDGGCPDGTASDGSVRREVVLGPDLGHLMLTWSGLAFAPNGNLYAASVFTGRIAEYATDGLFVRMILEPSRWFPPFETGTPAGLAVDREGTLYYADLDLVRKGWFGIAPGRDGKIWRIRFDREGVPLAPEVLVRGLRFPDAVSVIPGDLEDAAAPGR